MGQKTIKQYWGDVFKSSISKAAKFLGLWGRIISAIVGSVGTGAVAYWLSGNAITAILTLTAVVVIWMLIWGTVSIIYAMREPIILHNKQADIISGKDEDIKKLEGEISDLKGESEIVRLIGHIEPRLSEKQTYRYATVRVTNNENVDLTDCVGSPGEITYQDLIGLKKPFQVPNPIHFHWSSKGRIGNGKSVTIPAEGSALLDIAIVDNGRMKFNFSDDPIDSLGLGRYYLSIVITGKKEGVSFVSKPQEFYLEFHGGDPPLSYLTEQP